MYSAFLGLANRKVAAIRAGRLVKVDRLSREIYLCGFKRLTSEGWFLVGGKGDHEKFKHATKPGHVVVPHPRKDIAIGTLRNIYRQVGWNWKE